MMLSHDNCCGGDGLCASSTRVIGKGPLHEEQVEGKPVQSKGTGHPDMKGTERAFHKVSAEKLFLLCEHYLVFQRTHGKFPVSFKFTHSCFWFFAGQMFRFVTSRC